MRAIKPGMETKYSRHGVGLNGGICCAQGLENFGINDVHEGGTDVVNTNGVLQLRHGDPIQDDSAVAIVVKRAESAEQLKRSSSVIGDDGSGCPTPQDPIDCPTVVQEFLAFSDRQIVGSIDMHGVANVKESRTVALAQIA